MLLAILEMNEPNEAHWLGLVGDTDGKVLLDAWVAAGF